MSVLIYDKFQGNAVPTSSNMKKLGDLCLKCIGEHLHSIPAVSRYLANMHKEILFEQLTNHDKLTPQYIHHITYNLFSSGIKRLTLYRCDQVTDALLKQMCSLECRFKWINVHGCANITDTGLQALTLKQDSLQSLELVKLPNITSKGLVNILSCSLTKLDLRGCTSITSEGIHHILQKNRTIKDLGLAWCANLNDSVFGHVATYLGPTLERLDATSLHFISDSSLKSIADNCCNLKCLNLHGCNRVTSEGVGPIFRQCQQLSDLDLSYCSKLQNSPDCEVFREMPVSLQEVCLCGVMLTDPTLLVDCMIRLSRVTTIRLCGIPALNDDTLGQILTVLGPNLLKLDLSGSIMCSITDDSLKHIAKHCAGLETLALSLLRDVTGETLLPLLEDENRACELKTLLISCKKLAPAVADAVAANCKNLERLDLAGLTWIDDFLLVRLAENCPKLSYLNVKGCRQVTDMGVTAIARHCPITTLVLSGCHQVTDSAIFCLANSCPYIDELHLNGCAMISCAAVRYLQDQVIPRVWVTHKVPNAAHDELLARNLDTGNFCRSDQLPAHN